MSDKKLEKTEFLNCNYPNKCCIPTGKPKGLKKIKYSITKNKITMYVVNDNEVWFKDGLYYFGIRFNIIYKLSLQIYETIGKINLDLLSWDNNTLRNEYEYLLGMHLKIIA